MESSDEYSADSVADFLMAVADRIDSCADHGTQGDWVMSKSPRTFINAQSGGVVCGVVQKSNARLILPAAPEGARAIAQLLRAAADQSNSEQVHPSLDAAFKVACHYNQKMRLKADDRLRPSETQMS